LGQLEGSGRVCPHPVRTTIAAVTPIVRIISVHDSIDYSELENSGVLSPLRFVDPTAPYLASGANPPPGRLVSTVFFLLVVLVSCADLKRLTSDRVHWAAVAVFLVIALPMMARARWKLHGVLAVAGSMMVCAVFASGWAHPFYAFLEAGKLALILGLFTFLLINHPQLAHTGFLALETATWLNVLCLGTLLIVPGPLASLMAPGRWGTALNVPGSLWRLGAATFVCGAYRVMAASRVPLRGFALCAASTLLIYADGSRTAMLLLMTAVPFLFGFGSWELRRRARTVRVIGVAAALCACAFGILDLRRRALASDRGLRDAILRVQPLLEQLADSHGDGLAHLDMSRSEMLDTALARLGENPIWGGGIGRTRVQSTSGSLVVHMTYLQVWSDLGILGLLGYVGFTFFWLPGVRRARSRIRLLARVEDRALYSNAIFVLMVFCAAAFFHPLSTEFPEWLPFLMAAALFTHLTSGQVVVPSLPTTPQAPAGESPAALPALQG
jgi:hypothetical protein